MKQLSPHVWTFDYLRIQSGQHASLHQAIDLWEAGDDVASATILKRLVHEYPEFIDAYHHLAMIRSDQDELQEAFDLWSIAIRIGMRCIPETFYFGVDQLPWGLIAQDLLTTFRDDDGWWQKYPGW